MREHGERQLPTGTLTFLFTDIEGSTRLLTEAPDGYEQMLARHAEILRSAIRGADGVEVNTEGDAFFAVFDSAGKAVQAAVSGQRALDAEDWPAGRPVRVRMGLHTGEGRLGGDDYVGMDVHRASRVASAAHGGQIVISGATAGLISTQLPEGVALRDLGEHRLKDLPAREHIWQLDIEGLPSDFPPLATLDARPNNLPAPATPLIGRDKELRTVEELLERRRLVTLTGAGGTGKTRTALAAANRLLPNFQDGAFFVALEDAHDRQTVVSGIAAALNVREKPDRDLEQGVKDYLRERELLLVLDNFEQVLVAAPLVAELLAGAPRFRTVVTSREPLRIADEQEYPVPPLRVPDLAKLPSIEALSQYDSVALFIERASSVQPDFQVTNENAPAVAEICSRLDGLPLAIELAAARIKLLNPQQILERLEKSLTFLTGGGRDRSDRQRTLRGAIEWSYELLDDPEKDFFTRLGVFAGGWTMEACEKVCNPDGELGLDTLDGLTSLADKSLIHKADAEGDELRFDMLQVIREFALDKLDARPDGEETRRWHARAMMDLAELAEPELVRADQRSWQDRLRREEENLRAALLWTTARGEAEIGMRIGASIWRFWHYWARVREGRRWLDGLLAAPDAAERTVARARALSALAALVYWQGDAELATRLYEEALSIYEQHDSGEGMAATLMDLAWAAAARGDGRVAGERAHASLAKYRELGDAGGAARVGAWLRTGAYLLDMGGSFDDAVAANLEDLETARREGRAHDVAEAFGALAIVYRKGGEYAKGLEFARKELAELDAMGHIGRHGPFLKLMAAFELELGQAERAATLAAASRRWVQELGGELPEALTHSGEPLDRARERLSPEDYAQAVERGNSMSLEHAVAFALEEAEPAAPANG